MGTNESRGGFIVWLTGLSGAGKTTLARALEAELARERDVVVVDSGESTSEAAQTAREQARSGALAINATISPLRRGRAAAREGAAREGIAFVEIYIEAPPQTLIARDPHGAYQRALAGADEDVAGVTSPYEPPRSPDIRVRSDLESVAQSTRIIMRQLERRGLVGVSARSSARSASRRSARRTSQSIRLRALRASRSAV